MRVYVDDRDHEVCHRCFYRKPVIINLGTGEDGEICAECLEEAIEVYGEYKKNPEEFLERQEATE